MKRSILLTLVALALARALEVRTQEPSRAFAPVTDATLRPPDPADWLTWRRTLDGWGYGPLDQINRANVARLRMVWTRALGPGLQEGTPLVHDGVMYVIHAPVQRCSCLLCRENAAIEPQRRAGGPE